MKIFVDSSIFVVYIKDKNNDLLESIISSENELYINSIVYSEVMFYFLAIIGNKLL